MASLVSPNAIFRRASFWLSCVGLVALAAGQARAQRIQFPSAVNGPQTFAPATPGYGAGPVYGAPPASFSGGVVPAPAFDPYGNPSAAPPAVAPYSSYPAGPPPAYSNQPPALFPNGLPSLFNPGGYYGQQPGGGAVPYPRLFKEVRVEHTWLEGDVGNDPFLNLAQVRANPDDFDLTEQDIHTSEISGTLQFPFLYNRAPLLVTPGLAVHLFEAPGAFLPPRFYDAYLDVGWQPELTPWLSADLGVRGGIFTDFDHTTTDSLRLMGRGLGILNLSPQAQVALGVIYLDRVDLKLLPAGGLIWTPNPDARYEILFPRPKLARHLTTVGTTEWWWYLQAEYGGGSWTVVTDPVELVAGTKKQAYSGRFDYNDYRTMLGLEFRSLQGIRGHVEFGYVFHREYAFDISSKATGRLPTFETDIDETFMVRGGLSY